MVICIRARVKSFDSFSERRPEIICFLFMLQKLQHVTIEHWCYCRTCFSNFFLVLMKNRFQTLLCFAMMDSLSRPFSCSNAGPAFKHRNVKLSHSHSYSIFHIKPKKWLAFVLDVWRKCLCYFAKKKLITKKYCLKKLNINRTMFDNHNCQVLKHVVLSLISMSKKIRFLLLYFMQDIDWRQL